MPRTLLALLLPAGALGATFTPASVTASSTYPPENGVRYDAAQLLDGRVGTAWIEGERGSGLGSFVEFALAEARELRGIRIWNGYWFSSDLWQRHNRMKDVELTFSDSSKLSFTLKDAQSAETLTFPKPVNTTSLKLKFKSVYTGTTFGDTPISEIQLLDTAPDPHPVPATLTASTTYPADADASYAATNLIDGLIDTAWCEGDKKGDGTGQWVEFTFPAPVPLASLRVRNGNAASPEDNAAANQPTAATLTFADGTSEALTLAASPDPQLLQFPPHLSAKVRLTFTAVAKGSTYDDLCVSEVEF